MEFSPVGVWQGGFGLPAASDRAFVAEVEQLGYGAFWFGEAPGGKDAFVRATDLLAASSSIVVGTGIASIWGRDPLTTAAAIRTIGESFPGRFIAGLGVSHAPIVESTGHRYERPLARMRDYLNGMREGRLLSPEPAEQPPVLLAALRPRMLELAATSADGAHPYFVPVEHTRRARAIVGQQPLLAPELAVVLERDPVEARRLARVHTSSFYLDAPNYVENLRWLGFDSPDFANGGSDDLVDALVAWGDVDAIAIRVQEHLDAGADHVCVQPVTNSIAVLRTLAPVLAQVRRTRRIS